jgi:hypothetical protein
MELGYVERMSQKDADERFGPRPLPRARQQYETKWRTEPALYEKVRAAAAVEECKAELESGGEVKISVNAQLNFIVEQFIATYEQKFGPLPSPDDKAALKKYAQRAEAK